MDLENMFKKKAVPARTDISQAGNKPEVPEGPLGNVINAEKQLLQKRQRNRTISVQNAGIFPYSGIPEN